MNTAAKSASEYNGIDLMKFICAILVLFIHTHPLKSISIFGDHYLVNTLCRMAVPFFFMASGFFFYRKILVQGFKTAILVRYIRRLLLVYLAWTVIYLPYDLIYSLFKFPDTLRVVLIYLKSIIFTGSHVHLWYLPALITAVSLLFFLAKYLRLWVAGLIFLLLYCIGLLGDSYYGLAYGWGLGSFIRHAAVYVGSTRDGLFFGAVYVFAGAWFAVIEKRIKPDLLALQLIAIACFLVFITEVLLLTRLNIAGDFNMTVWMLPAVFTLFVLAAKTDLVLGVNYVKLREMSSFIYFFHCVPIVVFDLLLPFFTFPPSVQMYVPVIRFVVTLIVTLLAAGAFSNSTFGFKKLLI
jgi:serine/alanine racemase